MSARYLGTADLDLMESLFAALPDCPFFVKDLRLRYVAANASMAKLAGCRIPARLYGRTAGDIFPRQFAKRYERLDRQVLKSGKAITNRLDLSIGAASEPVWLHFSRVPIRDEKGEVVGLAATSQRLRAVDRAHPTYERLALVADHLRTQVGQPLRLAELSKLAGVSASQLERDFYRLFGMTPRSFLHKSRIDHAMTLLDHGAKIADIASACGYADQSAFTRRFRELVGVPPSRYRKHASGR